ncbi:MAG: hypothetical protein AAGA66_09930 [Bacteroidota bacterium]
MNQIKEFFESNETESLKSILQKLNGLRPVKEYVVKAADFDTAWILLDEMEQLIREFLANNFDLKDKVKDKLRRSKNVSFSDFAHMTTIRSEKMDEFARSTTKRGLWKIGDEHVMDIKKMERKKKVRHRPYNLLDRKGFNKLFDAWSELHDAEQRRKRKY